MARSYHRLLDQMRPLTLEPHHSKHAEGSCLVTWGDTKVICTASVDDKVPPFLKNTGTGWITAEYGMLPRATHSRTDREASKGKQTGRTQEIQRLIGRSLRACVDLTSLGERQIKIDCDVIQADGGTRTAAITGGCVALYYALDHLLKHKLIKKNPMICHIAALSCGIVNKQMMVDLDYDEDSQADVDANFVINDRNELIEIQMTGEKATFTTDQLMTMVNHAIAAAQMIFDIQKKAMGYM